MQCNLVHLHTGMYYSCEWCDRSLPQLQPCNTLPHVYGDFTCVGHYHPELASALLYYSTLPSPPLPHVLCPDLDTRKEKGKEREGMGKG